jgi:hypothetical protein
VSEPDYRKDMDLPPGKKCGDCFASRHCIALGISTADRTSCDFWPNRFKEPKREDVEAAPVTVPKGGDRG